MNEFDDLKRKSKMNKDDNKNKDNNFSVWSNLVPVNILLLIEE